MNLFNFKAKKAKKAKLELIEKMDGVKARMESASLYGASRAMDGAIDYVDKSKSSFSEEQVSSVNEELESMGPYLSKPYEEILQDKCGTILKILRDGPLSREEKASAWNNEKIKASLVDQVILKKQIDDIDAQMKESLGNKSKWQLLFMKKRNALNRLAIIEKNYQSILKQEGNIALTSEVKEAQKDAKTILDQNDLTDATVFGDNVADITQAADETIETSNEIDDIFAKNFGTSSLDGAYEKALEEAKLEKATASQEAAALGSEEPK